MDHIKKLFSDCYTAEDRYQKLISLGKDLPKMDPTLQIEENLVPGCQSIVYLSSEFREGKLYFSAQSDALISSGLAMLLILAYNGHTPIEVVQEKPLFIEELHISSSLSPSRSNGLANIYLKMQKEALKFLLTV